MLELKVSIHNIIIIGFINYYGIVSTDYTSTKILDIRAVLLLNDLTHHPTLIQTAVLNGFGNVVTLNLIRLIKICNSTSHF